MDRLFNAGGMIIEGMNPNPELAARLQGVCALPALGVIQAQGEDAVRFLHNQLTNDLLLLPAGQACLAAWCNAKGRMQVSLIAFKLAPDTVLLVLPTALLAQTLKRLSMFVLRAKVKLSDASQQWCLRGLLGEAAQSLSGDAAAWKSTAVGAAHVLALYPANLNGLAVPRGLWIGPADASAPQALLDAALWDWAEVLSAVPLVGAALFEAFVPQMLNYESVGAVNFKKGCYPGQEVVARSQFRGILKRRMARVFSPVALQAGESVFTPTDPEQPCGVVVQASARPDHTGFDALVSGTIESMSTGWHAGSAEGEQLALLPLPYPLLNDI